MISGFLIVGAGGSVGAVSRLMMSALCKRFLGTGFPWGTFIINVIGSFLIGFLAHQGLGTGMHLFLTTGILGGFTTFSTFNYESMNLLKEKRFFEFAAYVLGTYLICMTMTGIGYYV